MARGTFSANDPQLLEAALEGLELQRQRIEEQIRNVRAMLGQRGAGGGRGRGRGRAAAAAGGEDSGAEGGAAPARKKRRPLSAAARKRIAAAQKKRWANFRKEQKAE